MPRPFPDGPAVRACDLDAVRTEFYRQYPAEGDEKQKAEARKKAFNRAVANAQAANIIATREMGGAQLIWLASADAEPGTRNLEATPQ